MGCGGAKSKPTHGKCDQIKMVFTTPRGVKLPSSCRLSSVSFKVQVDAGGNLIWAKAWKLAAFFILLLKQEALQNSSMNCCLWTIIYSLKFETSPAWQDFG